MDSTLEFNFFNIFILSASIHGLVFGLIILFSKKFNKKANKYLAYIVLLISLNNIYYWVFDSGLRNFLEWKYYPLYYVPFDLLMLPIYYYFVTTYLGKKHTVSKYYILPFYLSSSVHIGIILAHTFFRSQKKAYLAVFKSFNVIMEYFSIVFTIFIIYKVYKLITSYEKESRAKDLKTVIINTKWLKQLLYVAFVICAFWGLALLYNLYFPEAPLDNRSRYYFVWISMSLLIYWLGYLGIYHLGIFNQRQAIRANIAKRNKSSQTNNVNNASNRFQEIDHLITQERLYLNPNLSMGMLAEKFNLSEGYLSQLINNNTGENFSTYLNNLRIEESKLLLTNSDYKNYTIIAIALESGFNSKSTFYNAFKKQTGVSPSDFKKSHLNLS